MIIFSEYLFDALEVYEICRRYSSALKISPILFEDFCAALISVEQSKILAEIHVQLLKYVSYAIFLHLKNLFVTSLVLIINK